MRLLAYISLAVMNGLIMADLLLSEVGTRRGISQEGSTQWRAADGSFRAMHYLLVYLAMQLPLSTLTFYLTRHLEYGIAGLLVLVVCNSVLGLKHLLVVVRWTRLFLAQGRK